MPEVLDPEAILEQMARSAKSERVRADAAKALMGLRLKAGEKANVTQDAIDQARLQLLENMTREERDLVAGVLQAVLDRASPPPETPAGRSYLEQKMKRLWTEYSGVRSQLGLETWKEPEPSTT